MTRYYGTSRDEFGWWQAAITDLSEHPLMLCHFGSYRTELEAAMAHDMAALLFHGRYAKNLNFTWNNEFLHSIETYRDQLMETYGARQYGGVTRRRYRGVRKLQDETWATVKCVIYRNRKEQKLCFGIFGTDVAAALLSDYYEDPACGNNDANLNFPRLAGNGMVTVAVELARQQLESCLMMHCQGGESPEPESGMTHCQGGESPELEDYMMHCQGGEGESPELGGGMQHCQRGESPEPEGGMNHCQDGYW